MATIRFTATFRRDFAVQLEYLADRDDAEGSARLLADLRALVELVTTFPQAGRELDAKGSERLRKLRLRRCPFVVWYVERGDDVQLARLFHSRQEKR